MRRIALWFLATVSTVVLLFGYKTSTSSTMPEAAGTGGTTTPTSPTTASGSGAGTTTPGTATGTGTGTTTSPTGTGTAKDGTVAGSVSDTRWGPVQVQVTVAGGKITAVQVLQQPSGNGKDREINADALPTLIQETLSAQSAKIDMVSGATVTSDGYVASLQSALDQAGIA